MNRKQIKQKAELYTLSIFGELDDFSEVVEAYIEGAEWMQKIMIDKAIAWLFENVYDYLNAEDQERVESFKKAMEE